MDGYGFHALGLIAASVVLAWVLDWGWRMLRRSDKARREAEAARVLRAHGMEAYTYLPSFGAEAGELRDALTAFDFTNQVVLDREGRMVGRVLPKVQASGSGLRLVVDNTK